MLIVNISDQVPMLSVPHLFHFICISKQLKNDILLAQPAEEPEDNTSSLEKMLLLAVSVLCYIPIFWHSKAAGFPRYFPTVLPRYFRGISTAISTEYPKETITRSVMQKWHSRNMSQHFWERNMVEHSRPRSIRAVTEATY